MRKTAIVTGGAGGIGREICICLAKHGYNILINYNKSREKAEKLAVSIAESGGSAASFSADVKSSASVAEMVSYTKSLFGTVDLLVNNAGISGQALFTDITDEMWQEMLDTNLTGAFYCCRAVLPEMIRRKAGRIINISSMWGVAGGACEVHYSAAKAGLIGLTRALAKEAAPSGVFVNAIAPGVIDTDMCAGFDDKERAALIEETPCGRMGTPHDIARAVMYLAEDSFTVGQVLCPNGGFII